MFKISLCTLALCLCTLQAFASAINTIESTPEFCHDLECPAFKVKESTDAYELRSYAESIWVSTNVESIAYGLAVPRGFKKLFDYIQGNNEDGVTIPMTAPVRVEVHPSQGPFCKSNFTVSFYVPCEFQESTPKPSDPDVYISREDQFKVYVGQSGGFVMDDFSLSRMAKRLTDALDADGIDYDDYFFFAGYDPPFRLKGRHNEIWIKVKEDSNPEQMAVA